MQEMKDMIKFISAGFFNCFYTVFDPLTATRIRNDFDINVLLWNLLFNLGFFYTSFKNLFEFVTYKIPSNGKDTRKWESFGSYISSVVFRILYSRYRSKAYFPLIPTKFN
jgi:hypothetical protein